MDQPVAENTAITMDEFMAKIEKHRNEFYRYILRTVWDTGVTDDVFASAVLAAWENRHKFTPGTNFRAWVYRIITNKCFVANRETGRTPQPLENTPESAFLTLGGERGYQDILKHPESVLEQCGDELNMAIKKLSTAQRSCIMLRSVEKLSYKEIAEVLDIPVGTVMTHLSRGRARLRKDLLNYARERGVVRDRPRLIPKKRNLAGSLREADGGTQS